MCLNYLENPDFSLTPFEMSAWTDGSWSVVTVCTFKRAHSLKTIAQDQFNRAEPSIQRDSVGNVEATIVVQLGKSEITNIRIARRGVQLPD
jgi:hypothetical protein